MTEQTGDKEKQVLTRLAVAFVDTCSDAIIGQDLTGRIVSWNKSAERLYGFPAAEAIGQSAEIITVPAEAKVLADRLAEVKRGQNPPHFETSRRRRDGSAVRVRLALAPIHDEAGALIGWSDIARDITNQTNLANELIKSNERLRLLFEQAPIGFFMVDGQGRLVDFNATLEKITGYARDELKGMDIKKLASPEGGPNQEEALQKILDDRPRTSEEFVVLRKDGQKTYVEAVGQSITIQNEKFILGAAIDVTERRRYQVELDQRVKELERMNRLMIGREMKMVELKKELSALKQKSGLTKEAPAA